MAYDHSEGFLSAEALVTALTEPARMRERHRAARRQAMRQPASISPGHIW
jgi:hypothetical protein